MRPLLLAAALLALPALVCAQGSLTPPAAPAPSMKTLDQLEPRTPLQAGAPGVTPNANGGFTIASPGSYYLTGNLTVASGSAITITTSNVTLDLRGFTIASTAATAPGTQDNPAWAIGLVGALSAVSVGNGAITSGTTLANGVFTNAGFNYGLYSETTEGCSVADLTVSGTAYVGIYLSPSSPNEVRNCSVSVCSTVGIYAATVGRCNATNCGLIGIWASTATDCFGQAESGAGGGPSAINSAVNCVGVGHGAAAGLYASAALNCTGRSDRNAGLQCDVATNCTGGSQSGTGLKAQIATNCVGTTTGNGVGLDAETATGCRGESVNNTGLRTDASAENCRGIATGSGYGLYSGGTATNCTGVTHSGAYGLYSVGTANTCRGKNDGAGAVDFSLHAGIAVACTSEKGVIESPSKQLGTP